MPLSAEVLQQAQDVFLETAETSGVIGGFLLIRTAGNDHTSSFGSNTKTFTGTLILQLVDEGCWPSRPEEHRHSKAQRRDDTPALRTWLCGAG